jgi:subtilase family serine protease
VRRTRLYLGVAVAAMMTSGLVVATAGPVTSTPLGARAHIRLRPMLYRRFLSATQVPTEATCIAKFTEPCYTPLQLERAYNEEPLFHRGITGTGETIVIVDSFGAPTIRPDLTTFDATFHLTAPPSFRIIQPAGVVPPFNPKTTTMVGWAGETTLDVEYSHAVAPGANILLVETPTSETEGVTGFPAIVAAENYVINHHLGGVISQSFGATEETFPSATSLLSLRSAIINAYRNGVTMVAAAGDAGATTYQDTGSLYYTSPVTSWPPSDPLVTAVGGTELHLNTAGTRTSPDSVWNDTYNSAFDAKFFNTAGPLPEAGGGGVSSVFARPFYQSGVATVVGGRRGVPDISMSASCSGSVITYFSAPGTPAGYYYACGTSEATPEFAGIVALADQVAGRPLGLINPALYQLSAEHAPGIVDVTQGNNTVTFTQQDKSYTVKGYAARPGYDLASGVGTITAAKFVPELASAARVHYPNVGSSSSGGAAGGLHGLMTT